ncbi:RNA-guided endonuclease InsQ/TnpB family protein [Haladaptatus halobius]|uniref:RNA-guided endonuclease InsQ/TnpB family protein n=1 Tax=Haladaptatus halobius TaxID=2884875 RepID=UPI001D0B126F|nr:transposase [Haladaptatus halobius]
MDITFRFRAYPDEDTASEAWRHIDIHRQIRNHAVRDYHRSSRNDRPSRNQQVNKLPGWKQRWPLWKEVSAHAAQQTVRQIHNDLSVLKSHRENDRKTGRLKWQGAGEFRSVAYQSEGFNVNHTTGQRFGTFTLSKIGENIPFRVHRDIPDTENVKRVILKKERTGEWFVCFVVEADEPEKPDLSDLTTDNCVGIDLGILSYIHMSDDCSVDCLDLTDSYDRYARAQRKLARKEHGSSNWEKQRVRMAKAKRRIKRRVLDYQHKLTTWLVKRYEFIGVEDLDVTPMLETSQSAKNRQDAAWSRFVRLLQYKAKLHGVHVVPVEPKDTTKACNQCGVKTDKPLWVREHSCPACGHEDDRDLNAAKNVLDKALAEKGVSFVRTKHSFQVNVGQGLPESTPVQTVLPTSTRRHSASMDAKYVVEAGSPASPDAG